MRRFFIENSWVEGDLVRLGAGESRHITKVLRLAAGDKIELFDGAGKIYSALLEETGKVVLARITGEQKIEIANLVRIIVGQGLLKGKKMDLVVQKCTELGVNLFQPFWSSRCQGKISEHQGQKKLERYQRIIESACKQCYRPDLMEIGQPIPFTEVLTAYPDYDNRVKLLFWEEEDHNSLHDPIIREETREVVALLGPEGGLSKEEAEAARSYGWYTVSLGPRILRAETATLTAVSIVQYLTQNI